jgi:hypothetical protein
MLAKARAVDVDPERVHGCCRAGLLMAIAAG